MRVMKHETDFLEKICKVIAPRRDIKRKYVSKTN